MPGDVAKVWLRIFFFQCLLFIVPFTTAPPLGSATPIHLKPWKERNTSTPILSSADATAAKKFTSMLSTPMSGSVLASGKAEANCKKKPKAKAQSKAKAKAKARDPESSPERGDDKPIDLNDLHMYIQDIITVLQHAVNVAGTRSSCSSDRRESVMVDCANVTLHFNWSGGSGGITWDSVKYESWSAMRDRVWNATLSFMTMSTDIGSLKVPSGGEDEKPADDNRSNESAEFTLDIMKGYEGDEAVACKTIFDGMQGFDITMHSVYNAMKNAVLSECCKVGFMSNTAGTFTNIKEICPEVLMGVIEDAISSSGASPLWRNAYGLCSSMDCADTLAEEFVGLRCKYVVGLMLMLKQNGLKMASPHDKAWDFFSKVSLNGTDIYMVKLCQFDWFAMDVPAHWKKLWVTLISQLGVNHGKPDCLDSSVAVAQQTCGVKAEPPPTPAKQNGQQDAASSELKFTWPLRDFLKMSQGLDFCDFGTTKRLCTLIEHDAYMNSHGQSLPHIQMTMTGHKDDPAKKVPNMSFECSAVSDPPARMFFAGNVSTRASTKSIEIGTVGGHKLYLSEPDFDSDAWTPAWGVPFSSKKDTPTVLMRHVDAELDLPEGLIVHGDDGQPLSNINVKFPYLEVNQCGQLLRPKLPDVTVNKDQLFGPRGGWSAAVNPEPEVPQADGQQAEPPAERKRKATSSIPQSIRHILS